MSELLKLIVRASCAIVAVITLLDMLAILVMIWYYNRSKKEAVNMAIELCSAGALIFSVALAVLVLIGPQSVPMNQAKYDEFKEVKDVYEHIIPRDARQYEILARQADKYNGELLDAQMQISTHGNRYLKSEIPDGLMEETVIEIQGVQEKE